MPPDGSFRAPGPELEQFRTNEGTNESSSSMPGMSDNDPEARARLANKPPMGPVEQDTTPWWLGKEDQANYGMKKLPYIGNKDYTQPEPPFRAPGPERQPQEPDYSYGTMLGGAGLGALAGYGLSDEKNKKRNALIGAGGGAALGHFLNPEISKLFA